MPLNFGILQPAQEQYKPLLGAPMQAPAQQAPAQQQAGGDGGLGELFSGLKALTQSAPPDNSVPSIPAAPNAGQIQQNIAQNINPQIQSEQQNVAQAIGLQPQVASQANSATDSSAAQQSLGKASPDLIQSPAYQESLKAYTNAQEQGIAKNPLMTVVDFSQPATDKRLYVVNPQTGDVVMNTYVAQGKPGFSNDDGSHQSSLGTFLTGAQYEGSHGTSLRVQGLDAGVNDNANKRGIVVHGADYIGDGKTGQSWGCFAVPQQDAQQLTNLMQGGGIIHAYAPNSSQGQQSSSTSYVNDPSQAQGILSTPGNNPFRPDSGAQAAVPMIKNFEKFSPNAYWDVNAYRSGYGSDTVTKPDGTVAPVTSSTTVTQEDADRDLNRRSVDFENTARNQVGNSTWNSLPVASKAALTSVAYNYGSLPARIVPAVQTGNPDTIADAVQGLQSDNKGINAGRRQQEANAIRSNSLAPGNPTSQQPLLASNNPQQILAQNQQQPQAASAGNLGNIPFSSPQIALNDGYAPAPSGLQIPGQTQGQLPLAPTPQRINPPQQTPQNAWMRLGLNGIGNGLLS